LGGSFDIDIHALSMTIAIGVPERKSC